MKKLNALKVGLRSGYTSIPSRSLELNIPHLQKSQHHQKRPFERICKYHVWDVPLECYSETLRTSIERENSVCIIMPSRILTPNQIKRHFMEYLNSASDPQRVRSSKIIDELPHYPLGAVSSLT